MIRPSLTIHVEVPADVDAAAAKRSLTRAFSYVCPVTVGRRAGSEEAAGDRGAGRSGADPDAAGEEASAAGRAQAMSSDSPASDGEAGDERTLEGTDVRMNVRFPRPYWAGEGEGADENWEVSLLPWLCDKVRKVCAVTHGYQRFAEENEDVVLRFPRLVVSLKDIAVGLPLDAAGNLAVDDLQAELCRVRGLRAQGCLEGAAQVDLLETGEWELTGADGSSKRVSPAR